MTAERAAEFVLAKVREVAPHRWYQGRRREVLRFDGASEALRTIAEHRLWSVGELESRGLVGWAAGRREAVLFDRPIEPRELVALQAEGRRCVSLLENAPAQEALDFVLHDLRHLEKFFEAAHHQAQIGFFRIIDRALASAASVELDRRLDATWRDDRDKVLADMNGSPIFLFAVLKMKLKMAARRLHGKNCGLQAPVAHALSEEELETYRPLLEQWLDVLGLAPGPLRDAAREISARRDRPELGRKLLEYFTAYSEKAAEL